MIARQLNNLRIACYPDPVLRKAGRPVTEFGPELAELAARMFEIMRQGDGVGLAAPQVGVSSRVFVSNPTGEPGDDRVFINPRLSDLSGAEVQEEGCLSIPGVRVNMRRATKATIEAEDLEGRTFRIEAEGLVPRIWQHEIDHLDGKLILDNMSEADEIANRKAVRELKDKFVKTR